MTDYVVVALPKGSDVFEPTHPGHMDLRNARKMQRLRPTRFFIWTAEQWEDYQTEEQADLFCDECNMMKEDCTCNPCPVNDPDCEGEDGECHDACEPPSCGHCGRTIDPSPYGTDKVDGRPCCYACVRYLMWVPGDGPRPFDPRSKT